MKKILFLFSLLVTSLLSFSQTKGYLKYDSLYIQRDGSNAEMILLNGTRNVSGFLFNKGNGRTEFKQAVVALNDSTFVIGGDTLRVKSRVDLSAYYTRTEVNALPVSTFTNDSRYWDSVRAKEWSNLTFFKLSDTSVLSLRFVTVQGDSQIVYSKKIFYPVLSSGVNKVAEGFAVKGLLTASANNDTLVGLDVQPFYNLNSKSGVKRYGLRVGYDAGDSSFSLIKLWNNGIGDATGAAIEYPFGQKIQAIYSPDGFRFYNKNGTDYWSATANSITWLSSPTLSTSANNAEITIKSEVGTSSKIINSTGGYHLWKVYNTGNATYEERMRLSNSGLTLSNLAGTGTRMVTASSTGLIGVTALPYTKSQVDSVFSLGLPLTAGISKPLTGTLYGTGIVMNNDITANTFIKSTGTADQVMLANGEVLDKTTLHAGAFTFDTSGRVLTIPTASGGSYSVVIPRGTTSGAEGITALSSSRSGNLLTVSGDNGSNTIFSIRDADSASIVRLTDTADIVAPYTRIQRFLDSLSAVQLRIQTKQPLGAYITLNDSSTINAGRWLPNRSADSIAVIRALANSKGIGTVTSVGATGGTGISVSGSPVTGSGSFTITNTAPDQTVVLTAGTGIGVSGTYPNFTITNNSPSSGGTVTSITASAPLTGGTISSSGTIGITQASGSTNGFLSSTDWNTFNNKVSFTDALARAALSFTAGSGAYNSTNGVITIPTNNNQITNGSGFITLNDSTTINAGRWLPNRSADSIAVIRALANSKGSGNGTVTSVALSGGTGISVSGSPITGAGTITVVNTAPDQTVTLTAGTGISVSGTYPNFTVTNSSPSGGGTVTSVGLSAPTGFSVSGSPVSSSGTLALGFAAGYSLPTDASQTLWNVAYNKRLSSASLSTTQLTLTLADASTVTASVPTFNQNTTGTAASLSSVLASSLGGAGSVNGILKANGSGTVSAAVAGTDYVVPSALSNYVDLTNPQTVGGTKTYTSPINVTNQNINLSNAYFYSGKITSGTNIALIGMNASDKVSIDPNGYGVVVGNSIDAQSYRMAAWQHSNWTGSIMQLGGISASQWQQLDFYTNGVIRQTLSNSAATFAVPISGTSLSMSGDIGLGNGGSLTWGGAYGANIPTIASLSGAGSYIAFYPSGSTGSERARFSNGGNLLLKTTTDNGTDALQVAGSGLFKGTLKVASSATTGTMDFGTGSLKGIIDYSAGTGLWTFNNQTAGGSGTNYYSFRLDGTEMLSMTKGEGATIISNSTSKAGLVVRGGSTVGTASGASGQILVGQTATYRGSIAYDDNVGHLFIDNLYDNANSNIYLRTRTLGTPINALTIVGSGAATFSSSVTTSGAVNAAGVNISSGSSITIAQGDLQFQSNAGYGILSNNGSRAISFTNTNIGLNYPSYVNTTSNSAWAFEAINLGTTSAHGLYVNIGATSTGVPFRVDKAGSALLTVANSGLVTVSGSISTMGITSQGSQLAANFNGGFYGNSGGDYHTIGYNVGFTSSGGLWNYVYNDFSSFLRFGTGGFQFFTAPSGTGGTAISPTNVFTILQGGNASFIGSLTASSFIRSGGTSSQFLKADGSVDVNSYITSAVTSIAGTTNQVTVSSSTGSVTVSLPSAVTISGNMTAAGFFESSDKRLKSIISRDGDVAYFKWKNETDNKTHIGYIAQEVQKTNPDQVKEDEKGMLSVNYIEILVQKVRDLEKRVKSLEEKNK